MIKNEGIGSKSGDAMRDQLPLLLNVSEKRTRGLDFEKLVLFFFFFFTEPKRASWKPLRESVLVERGGLLA